MSEEEVRAATRARIQGELAQQGLVKHGHGVDDDPDVVDRHAEAYLLEDLPSSPLDMEDARALTARLLSGRMRACAAGRHQSGPAPLGYRRARLQGRIVLEVDAIESECVRLIFREYLRLKSLRRVIALLAAQGIRTRRGKAWSRAGLAWILRNELYVGRVHFGDVTASGKHVPIVASILFNKVGVLLAANDKRSRGDLIAEGRRHAKEEA